MKILCSNKKAYFNFEILSKLETGIVLKGSEVKAVMETSISLAESWVKIRNNEVWLIGSTINQYSGSKDSWNSHEISRDRKLLLHRKQIQKLEAELVSGFSLIPIDAHLNDYNKIKLTVALCKGKKLYDKRETIKKRDEARGRFTD